jgi:hypothetical protein
MQQGDVERALSFCAYSLRIWNEGSEVVEDPWLSIDVICAAKPRSVAKKK